MENSHILLVCIGFNNSSNTLSSLTIDDLFLMFHPFGQIRKIIIFSQKILLKAFVEFKNKNNADNAISIFNDRNLNNFGKIRVYHSPLQQLSFNNKFLSFKNFESINQNEYFNSLKDKLKIIIPKVIDHKLSFLKKNEPDFANDESVEGNQVQNAGKFLKDLNALENDITNVNEGNCNSDLMNNMVNL